MPDKVEGRLNELKSMSGMERWHQLANVWPALYPVCQAVIVQLAEVYFEVIMKAKSLDHANTPVKS